MDVYIYDWSCKTIGKYTYYIGFGICNDESRVAVIDHDFHKPMYVNKWLLESKMYEYQLFFYNLRLHMNMESSIECTHMKLRKLREGYKEPKDYISFAAQNLNDYETLKNLLCNSGIKVYETNIDPVTVFLNHCHLHRTGWVRLTEYTKADKTITIYPEYYAHYLNIRELNKHVVPDMRVMCMDIETYSHTKYKVPMAFDPSDEVRMIGTAYRYKNNTIKMAFCVDGIGDRILEHDDVTVVLVRDQRELIKTYVDYVAYRNPEVLMGFNHLAYDYAFLVDRYFRGPRVKSSYAKIKYCPIKPIKETWSSSAYKNNDFWMLDSPGVVDVDIMQFATREGYYKGHSLNEIATAELGEQKIDMDHIRMHEMFTNNKDDDILSIAEYCLKDCTLPLDIFDKKKILIGLLERARVQRVSPNEIYSKGSGQHVMGQLHYECSLNGYIMDEDKTPKLRYKGASVIDPKPGIYKDCATVDFSSLYPSIMISDNICYTTYVPRQERLGSIDAYIDIPVEMDRESALQHYKDNITEIHGDRVIAIFSFSMTRKGVIPSLVEKLIDARKHCKDILTTCSEGEKSTWNMRQYSYKIAANSIYGLLGSGNPYLTFPIGAACVTARGRYHLNTTITRFIREFNVKVIYGDTDSCFIKIDGCISYDMYKEACTELCFKISMSRIKLEFENAFSKLLILGKKHYVAIKYDETEYYRGVVSVRRNSSKLLKKTYNELVRVIMDSEDKREALVYVHMTLHAIMNGQVDPDDMKIAVNLVDSIIIKQNESLVRHMDDVGIQHLPNEKIYYLYVYEGDGSSHTSYRRHYDWVIKNGIKINYLMHIRHELMSEIDKLLTLVGLPPIIHQYVTTCNHT
jgi:DNA polymerase delta subunit 1